MNSHNSTVLAVQEKFAKTRSLVTLTSFYIIVIVMICNFNCSPIHCIDEHTINTKGGYIFTYMFSEQHKIGQSQPNAYHHR